jgi:hypothetical protein
MGGGPRDKLRHAGEQLAAYPQSLSYIPMLLAMQESQSSRYGL